MPGSWRSLSQLDRYHCWHDLSFCLLDPALLEVEITSDGELQQDEFRRSIAETLRDGGPWGQGYPEPLFDGRFEVLAWKVVAERHLKLEVAMGAQRLNAIEFGGWQGRAPAKRGHLAYRLEPDDYRGGDAVQLVIVHREDLDAGELAIERGGASLLNC